MRPEEVPVGPPGEVLGRHPSLDDRFDPAVRIVEYDVAWPVQAAEELRRLNEALGAVAVRLEHVGSTAVPGVAAKPIVDLQLSVVAIEPRARYVEPLKRVGYLFVPARESPDYHFFAIANACSHMGRTERPAGANYNRRGSPVGDWCNGNIGVSKTLARGSIPRSPASKKALRTQTNGRRGASRRRPSSPLQRRGGSTRTSFPRLSIWAMAQAFSIWA